MRVVGVQDFGGPEALQVYEVAEPHAGPGEVRINVRAAAVNPTDTYTRNGSRAGVPHTDTPHVPGMDVAGVVDEVGEGVTTVRIGDDVMAMVIPSEGYGGYSEYVVVPQRSVTLTPWGISHAEACTLPMNGLTAQLSLDMLNLAPGQTLAVTGAAGTYGAYVVELAKAAGLRVIADSSEADEPLVRSLGADVIVRRGADVAQRIREHAPDGVDGLADGSVQNEAATPAVRTGGGFATVRGWSGNDNPDVTVHHVWVRSYVEEWEKLDRLRELVESRAVSLRVAGRFPAAEAAEAHRRLERGGARGRYVIEF
jgi:hypothetical protein